MFCRCVRWPQLGWPARGPRYRVIDVWFVYGVQVGSVIGRVEAKDADAGPNGLVHYGLAAQSRALHGHLFSVRNSTGEIVVRSTIDRETASLYQLVLVAYDHGPDTLSAETTVSIHVDDVNDNSPSVTIHTLDSTAAAASASQALIDLFDYFINCNYKYLSGRRWTARRRLTSSRLSRCTQSWTLCV